MIFFVMVSMLIPWLLCLFCQQYLAPPGGRVDHYDLNVMGDLSQLRQTGLDPIAGCIPAWQSYTPHFFCVFFVHLFLFFLPFLLFFFCHLFWNIFFSNIFFCFFLSIFFCFVFYRFFCFFCHLFWIFFLNLITFSMTGKPWQENRTQDNRKNRNTATQEHRNIHNDTGTATAPQRRSTGLLRVSAWPSTERIGTLRW